MKPSDAPAYLNGRFMKVGECRVDVLDRGFLFGDAVYEVVPVYAGSMFEWEAHFRRLERSLAAIGISSVHSCGEWESILGTLISGCEGDEFSVYVHVTRGAGARDHAVAQGMLPTVFAMVVPTSSLPREVFHEGIAVVTGEDIRWARCDIKSTSLIANVMIKMQAVKQGAYDTILLRDGFVMESAAANVFIVTGGMLATAPESRHILPGITRGVIIGLARQHGVEIQERPIPAEELDLAEEIWLSSSTREILPVTRLDGKEVGRGVPGPMWERFREYIQAFAARSCAQR